MGESLPKIERQGMNFARVLKGAIICLAVFFTLQFFYIALSRIGYPFELEWFEGVMWQQVNLLLQTGQIYIEPSLDFISTLYVPFFTFLSAGLSSLFGHTFIMMRLVSLIAVIGSAILIYRLVLKYSKSHLGAIISVGIFFGSYAASGSWYDIGRVDSLQLFLMLATLHLALSEKKHVFFLAPMFATLSLFKKK